MYSLHQKFEAKKYKKKYKGALTNKLKSFKTAMPLGAAKTKIN